MRELAVGLIDFPLLIFLYYTDFTCRCPFFLDQCFLAGNSGGEYSFLTESFHKLVC